MQRTWATGTEHDQGPMEWLAAIGEDTVVAAHLRAALAAAIAPDATIAQGEAGLLAIECVTYIHGGDADLHPLVHGWMRELRPSPDEGLRTTALEVLAKVRASSPLATYWRTDLPDLHAAWESALDNLAARLVRAQRPGDPRTDPRILAFASDLEAATEHLRLALVPYAITDEPIVHELVAPGLSVVVHYADVGELDPVPVPIAHARPGLAALAAKRTREICGLKTHIIECAGFEISVAFGTSSFTAGLLPYANLLEPDAPHGLLIAAPTAKAIVYHRIRDATWNEAAVEIVGQVRELFEKSGEQISPQLWWWHEGRVTELPYAVVADNVMIEPIAAFVSSIEKLG